MKRLASESIYSINALCRLFGVSKQAYYQHTDDSFARLAREAFIVEFAQSIRTQSPGVGGEKLWIMHNAYFGPDHSIGRDAYLRVLGANNLLLRKRKKKCRTTDSSHNLPLYPDLIKDLLVERPNQVWVNDITYIHTAEGFAFLSLVTDAYTRRIVGWYLAPDLTAEYTLQALLKACKELKPEEKEKLIHHSDRGSQYASLLYTSYLKDNKIKISMTESGDPKDNAIAERVNGILKTEFLNYYHFENRAQAVLKLEEAVEFYNTRRPHRSLNMMTPTQAEQTRGGIKKRWKGSKDVYRIPEDGFSELVSASI